MEEFIARIGTFFILIGTFLVIMFIASDLADQTDFDYLFLAMMAIVAGWMMQKKRAKPPPAGRFAYLRRMREGSKQRQEDGTKDNKEEKK